MAERRRRMFIDPPEQLMFALRSTVHVLIFLLAASLLIYGPGEPGLRLSSVQRTTNEFLYAISARLWMLVPAILVVWLVSIIGSHRVVGPVFGFKNALKAVQRGDLTVRLHPRKGDHFGELASLINDTTEHQRETIASLRKEVENLTIALGSGESVSDLGAAREAVRELGRRLESYRV